jgi:hypothetical protein
MDVDGDEVLVLVRAQYVWRDSGLVGDEAPIAIELAFTDGKLIRWTFREDRAGMRGGSKRSGGG